MLYARRAGWFIGIRVMCPNHLTCCCLMCCRTGFAPAMSRITSFLILSRLVLFTAFLRHFISQVTSFLSRSFVSDHVWHWYVNRLIEEIVDIDMLAANRNALQDRVVVI